MELTPSGTNLFNATPDARLLSWETALRTFLWLFSEFADNSRPAGSRMGRAIPLEAIPASVLFASSLPLWYASGMLDLPTIELLKDAATLSAAALGALTAYLTFRTKTVHIKKTLSRREVGENGLRCC